MDVPPLTTGTLGVTIIAVLPAVSILFYFLKNKKTRQAGAVTEDGRPKVVLYQIGRGPGAPSVSPFPLKLETFLRMANIPYVNDHSAKFSSKGKTPWIEYDGVVVEDSQLCIEYLKQVLGVDMNRGLSPSERAISRALQKMTEENLYWTTCAHMFGDDLGPIRALLPYTGVKLWLTSVLVRRNIQKELWGHGIGRHSSKDIWEIGKADIKALSDYLGEKPFLMGDKPTEGDCAIFGMLAQIVWHMPGTPHESLVKKDYPNLMSYCCRMRDTFWPDWEACITTGKDFKGNN